jgi:hypothetical protein
MTPVSQLMLPPDPSFLAGIQAVDIDGQPNVKEKEMLRAVLSFYFGPAQWWNTVRKTSKDDNALNQLDQLLRKPGERYDILEQQTTLPAGYFAQEQRAPTEVKLYAATDTRNSPDNPEHLPSYFLYETKKNLSFYVGPAPGRPDVRVMNTLVLDDKHRPRQSHTSHFGYKDSEPRDVSEVDFFSDGASLATLQARDIDGPLNDGEKTMLLGALRFYFGLPKEWKAVTKDKTTVENLNNELQGPGKRYDILERQTSLGAGYFAREHQASAEIKFYAATDGRNDANRNPERLPSYFVYEAKNNLTFYIGPDLLHGRPSEKVINAITLNSQHSGRESHTLDFWFTP